MTKKALSLTEFADLTTDLQLDVLHKHGVYVGKRKLQDLTLVLFQLHGFYVEVHYRQYRRLVDRLITSDHPDILNPYLDQIKVRDLNRDGSGSKTS